MKKAQVLLNSILVIGGLLLMSTALAGTIVKYQLRSATDIAGSTKAIFAADTGIEWELYKIFKDSNYPKPVLTNEADFYTKNETVSSTTKIFSRGWFPKEAPKDFRAFELTLE